MSRDSFLLCSGLVCLLPAPLLQAETSAIWPVVQRWPAVCAQVSYQCWPSGNGWVVYLKNTGGVTLHFQPFFVGMPANSPKSSRVQLDPKGVAFFELPLQPVVIQLVSVRAGELDEGEYLK